MPSLVHTCRRCSHALCLSQLRFDTNTGDDVPHHGLDQVGNVTQALPRRTMTKAALTGTGPKISMASSLKNNART